MDPFTTVGLAFAVINLAVIINAHGRKVWVPRVGDWEKPPPVYVSTYANCTIEQVEKAAEMWRGLGHELGEVLVAPESMTEPPDGAIFFGLPDQTWNSENVGQANWVVQWPPMDEDDPEEELPEEEYRTKAEDIIRVGELGVINKARIAIDPTLFGGLKIFKVVFHELGHALGYLHVETAMLGRRKKDRKNGKAKAGDARHFLGLKVLARPTGHAMHPLLSQMGDITKKRNLRGLREDEDED